MIAAPLALLAALALGQDAPGAPAAGQPPPPASAGATAAFLEPVLDGVRGPPALARVEADGDVWMAVEGLAALGLRLPPGARRQVDGRELVSLRSLAPALSFALDEAALEVRLTADRTLLARAGLDLAAARRPRDLRVETVPAAFASYAVQGDTRRAVTGTLETGVSWRSDLLLSSASRLPDGTVVRGLSTYTHEDLGRLLRLSVGDVVTGGRPLGGSPVLAGVGIARDPALDPYLVTAALPRVSAFASTPSTIEVWVNGALARTVPVAPGTYDLSNLPVTTGQNQVQVLVRDAFGRTQALDASGYQAAGLLAPGLHTYSWNVGAQRHRFGEASADYRSLVLMGDHRLGWSDALTVGARLEATRRLASGGLEVVAGTILGELQLDAAASAGERPGAAAVAGWRYALPRGALGLDAAWSSTGYRNTTTAGAADPQRWRAGANGSLWVGRGLSLQLLAYAAERAVTGRRLEADLSAFVSLPRGVQLRLGAGLSAHDGRVDPSALVSLVLAPDPRWTVDATSTVADRVHASGFGVQRPLPIGEGYGYRARVEGSDAVGTRSAQVEGQTAFGRYAVAYQGTRTRGAATDVGSASAAGTLAWVDGAAFLSRPSTEALALVRVPEVPGVRTFLNNQPVGRTDRAGEVLVPGLTPYIAHRLSIADTDVPLDRRVEDNARQVALPRRGAALVTFPVARRRAVHGRVHVEQGGATAIPAYGTLVVAADGRAFTSPIAADGEFWLEELPAGIHRAYVLWKGEACAFALPVADAESGILERGDLACGRSVPREEVPAR